VMENLKENARRAAVLRAYLRLAGAVGVTPDGTFCAGEGRPFLADALLQGRGSRKYRDYVGDAHEDSVLGCLRCWSFSGSLGLGG